jgi:putative chitinase
MGVLFDMFDKLKGVVPQALIDQMPANGIDTPLRAAHFLAQVAHESGGFKFKSENLNYSFPLLLKIFPKYFNTETAKEYHRQPEKIANRVYANRMGNGDEKSGDGWKFKGRGYIGLTGKEMYKQFSQYIKNSEVYDNPDLVADDEYAALSSIWFWNKNGLNKIADTDNLRDDKTLIKITSRVNGGTIGLADRLERFNNYKKILL